MFHYELLISLYLLSLPVTICGSVVFVERYYLKLTDKYHGWQFRLRRGCIIVAVILVNLLSPLVFLPWFAVGTLLFLYLMLYVIAYVMTSGRANCFKQRWQSKQARSKFKPKNRSTQRSGGAELVIPSSNSFIADVLTHNQQDTSIFPYISSISELEDDDGSCPICLRSIYQPNINRSNIIEITHEVALDNEPCVTTCNHVMHYKCLREWLNLHQTCPICRSIQVMTRCKVFRCRYAVVKTIVRCDADTATINSHNGSTNSDMALPTISSEVPHMPTVLPGIHVRPEATSSEGYRELSVSVDLHDYVNDVIRQGNQTWQSSGEVAERWPRYDKGGDAILY